MSSLLKESGQYKKTADKLLKKSNLTAVLKKYGDALFVGSYSANLMMAGDIDICVVKDKTFSIKNVFDAYKDIYFSTNKFFRSYFVHGDWDDPRLGNEFPNGRYVGLKTRIDGEKWKIDIWFLSKKEVLRLKKDYLNINEIKLSPRQKELILRFKKYRQENNREYYF